MRKKLNFYLETSLHYAAGNGFLEVTKLLLERGKGFNMNNKTVRIFINSSQGQSKKKFYSLIEWFFIEYFTL